MKRQGSGGAPLPRLKEAEFRAASFALARYYLAKGTPRAIRVLPEQVHPEIVITDRDALSRYLGPDADARAAVAFMHEVSGLSRARCAAHLHLNERLRHGFDEATQESVDAWHCLALELADIERRSDADEDGHARATAADMRDFRAHLAAECETSAAKTTAKSHRLAFRLTLAKVTR